jgi:hypothetical protein
MKIEPSLKPARQASAAALGFSVLIDRWGGGVLLLSAALSLFACAALCLLRRPRAMAGLRAD